MTADTVGRAGNGAGPLKPAVISPLHPKVLAIPFFSRCQALYFAEARRDALLV